MSLRKVPLNPAQEEVLAWVRAGCPDGVYSDWSHRVTARALHHRGLVVIQGRGAGWSATMTDDGSYYLDHGTYPSIESGRAEAPAETAAETRSSVSGAQQPEPTGAARTPTMPQRRAAKVKKRGPVDQMMLALQEVDGHQIVVQNSQMSRYRQLAGAAKRSGRIPDGMQITVSRGQAGRSVVALEPLPAWRTTVLEPVHVPQRLL